MLTDIENKIMERLNLKLTGVSRIAIDEGHSEFNLKLPTVDVMVGGGTFSQATMAGYKMTPSVYVIVTFQHLRNVEERRKGVYPIIESIMALLIGNKLGLKIDALKPKRLDNITNEAEAEEGKIVIQIEFETSFMISTLSDEEITDLLRIGLNYYLQDPADDHVADASDTVTLSQS